MVPQWVANLNVGTVVVYVFGVLFVVGLFVKAWKAIRPMWVGTREFLEDWRGEPERDGVPGRDGVMKRLATIEDDGAATKKRVADIEHELHPNSGESFRDQVDKLGRELREHIAQQQG